MNPPSSTATTARDYTVDILRETISEYIRNNPDDWVRMMQETQEMLRDIGECSL